MTFEYYQKGGTLAEMKLMYIANVRMPTEKAHGVAIAKSCEAFAEAGVATRLIVPWRRTPIKKTVFEAYGVKPVFRISFLPTLDLLSEKSGPIIFWLQALTFQMSLVLFLFFRSRKTILYTREAGFVPLRIMGYRVVLECHLIPRNRKTFFALARRAHRIIVISEAIKRAFLEEGFSEKNVLVAPSGVDLAVFDTDVSKAQARQELGFPADVFVAVYTGNFTTMGADKGISDIIKALPKAPGVLFVAVGGAQKDRGRYTQEAQDLNVLDRVVFRGTTTQRMLALYQKAADVLLMPFPDIPHYRDHMSPVKMFEYMAAKRPIIASDLPTIREVLDENTAVLVPPGDEHALAQALRKAAEVREETRAEAAYQKVQQYAWGERTARVLNHIRHG